MSAFRLALVGAPNSGKSTLFNGLTGGRAKVANYAGVTVERRSGTFATPAGRSVELIDLPGIYGLSARSLDERIAVDVISGKEGQEQPPGALLVLVDAADLRTHLHLALQLKALGRPMLLVLNMIDLAERDGVRIDVPGLEARLGIPVVTTTATRKAGRAPLLARLDGLIEAGAGASGGAAIADLRAVQREARAIAREVILAEPAMNQLTRAIDRVVLNPVAGLFVLFGLLFLMFQAVFTWAELPMTWIEDGFAALGAWVGGVLADGWLKSLVIDGVIAGVGSVIVFLPQIVILFAFILALEASGYMARAAFLMDELMLRVGLNGRAFIPLLSSFACAIPGMMSARTIENENDRLTTILVAPLMTCSARLPVYTLIIAAFIPPTTVGLFNLQGLVMFGLYITGVISAVAVAFVLKRTLTQGRPQPLLMEMPTYKLPDPRDFFINLWMRGWAFLKRAGMYIFVISVILWFLSSYPSSAPSIRESYAGMLGSWLEPLLAPIGFNLEIAIALVPGFAAREVAVGALGTVYAVQADGDGRGLAHALQSAWSLPTALAFLAWYVFAPQCMATLAVARREMNSWRWTAFMFVYLFVMAYVAAGATFWTARWAGL
ncbi:MAG: ferrous iron transport protein B [Alphaproteobacteria bacterium]|nr:ferrous iron transport protein B [Alphaproteobacteria bacterium]